MWVLEAETVVVVVTKRAPLSWTKRMPGEASSLRTRARPFQVCFRQFKKGDFLQAALIAFAALGRSNYGLCKYFARDFLVMLRAERSAA